MEAIDQQLNEREAAFVRCYVRSGGRNASKAVIEAGYSPNGAGVQAHRLLHKDAVLAAIRAEVERTLMANVPLAADVLLDLAQSAKNESVRRKAAEALLDRGGMMLVARSEHTLNVVDKRTDAALQQQVARLTRELGLEAKVISASVLPVSCQLSTIDVDSGVASAPYEPIPTDRQSAGPGEAAESELPDLFD